MRVIEFALIAVPDNPVGAAGVVYATIRLELAGE